MRPWTSVILAGKRDNSPHFTTSFSKKVVVFLETSDKKLEDKFYHFMIGRRLNLLHKSRPHSLPRPGIDFLTGEEVGGKFWNNLFAEAVNTEINSMQVKNKVFAGRWRQTKKGAGAAYKKNVACENFPTPPPPPRPKKNNGQSLKAKVSKKIWSFQNTETGGQLICVEITGQLNSQGTNTSFGRTGVLSAGKNDCEVNILNTC